MPQNEKTVAIITIVNGDKDKIIRAVESVKAQSYQNYLHFIYDNGTDSRFPMLNYLNSHPDKHIVFASFRERATNSHAKNIVMRDISKSGAAYVAFLEPNDFWEPHHLQTNIDFIEKEGVEMTYSIPAFIDPAGFALTPFGIAYDQEPSYRNILQANTILSSSVLIKKECMDAVGEFDEELNLIENWDYWIRVLIMGFRVRRASTTSATVCITDNDIEAYNKNVDKMYKKYELTLAPDSDKIQPQQPVKLHLGCGSEILEGYINCDMYNTAADMLFDIREIPFPDNSVDEIKAYHVIEHLCYKDGFKAMDEFYRVLKPGGKIVIETPDFFNLCKKFVESNQDFRLKMYPMFFASPDGIPGESHLFMYTEDQLILKFVTAGFKNIVRNQPDSHHYKGTPEFPELFLNMTAYK